MKRNFAEFIGTFWLVLGGCGAAVFAAGVPELGIGYAGVAAAFGLTVLTGVYALGHISGGHFNPAVSFGLWAGGRFNGKEILPYLISQIIGAILAAAVIYVIASGKADFAIDNTKAGAFAANGYGDLSPQGHSMIAAIVSEFVMTFMFVLVIIGATAERAPKGFAGIAIGLMLTLIHLISIPVTNTSVNPARSISQAIFAGGDYIPQLWLFITIPILGALCAGWVYKAVLAKK
ncbi:MAG: aquaporin Z [Porphyromonadaceae bacterium]|nr:aquaporin Z [Porphyromonadaceae bacterium]